MAKRRDAFGSSFDKERPFTTAWGEYDPHQSSAWSDNGYTPDWAHPYDFNEQSSQRQRTRQASTASTSTIAEAWNNLHGAKNPFRAVAIALAIFFGTLGLHRFYIGDKNTGAIMAGLTLLSFGSFAWIIARWGFVDAYKYYQMSDIEFSNYCRNKQQVTA